MNGMTAMRSRLVYKLQKQINREILPLRVMNNDLDAQLNK